MTYILNNQLLGRLTRREMEVLRLVFSGLTSKKIAQQLSLSPRTVEVHRTNIMRKLDVTSVAQLADVVLRGVSRLEQLLIESESHLKEAQQIAKVGSWKWDLTNGSVTWSDEMYRIFELPLHAVDLSLELFLNALAPDDLERVKHAINQSLVSDAPYNIEYRIRGLGNQTKGIHAIGVVHRDAAGKAIGMAGTVQDITEQNVLRENR